MKSIARHLTAAATALLLSLSPLAAEQTKQAKPAKPKLSYSTLSTQSALPSWYPPLFLFDVATLVNSNTRVRGASGIEKLRFGNLFFSDLRGELGWRLGAVGSAASSASSNPFNNIATYLVLGAVLSQAHNEYILDSTGNPFATDGKSRFRGVYGGLNFRLAGAAGASSAASSAAAIVWTAFTNIGWGKGEVDAFGGGFRRSDTGLFYEIGTAVQADLGGVYVGPVLTYRYFDQSAVKREETTFGLRFTFKF